MAKNSKLSRRKFIKNTVISSAALAFAPEISLQNNNFDPKNLPTRLLGKTGIKVPIMALGTGSRFMAADTETGLAMLEYALDHGLYYWDTAANYKNKTEASEERLGRILKNRRKEVFLATKVAERDAEGAKKTIERSLKRLQTDYIDLYQVHSIQQMDDAIKLQKVYSVLKEYQQQGIIRYIGFTGHTSAESMAYVAKNYEFDTMLIALNHMHENQKFEQMAVPTAAAKNMGIIGMKVIRPRETVEKLSPQKLIRYALSLKHLTAANVGMDSLSVMKKNLEIIRQFDPLSSAEMKKLQGTLHPFFDNKSLPWLQPGYKDGQFA